jgi:hypothetical protein
LNEHRRPRHHIAAQRLRGHRGRALRPPLDGPAEFAVLSLRILFNSLRDGSLCLVETIAVEGSGSFCGYGERRDPGRREPASPDTPRRRWAWFVPSLSALNNMLADAGFSVRDSRLLGGNRAVALAERVRHADILRAGLSKPSIR